MARYIWQREEWPDFRWDAATLMDHVAEARFAQGHFVSSMRSLGFDEQLRGELAAMSADVVKTSAIEGETLDPGKVRSSIARRLGIPDAGLAPADRQIEGVVEMMLDVTRNHADPLTDERIFGWHAALFPTGYSGRTRIDIGRWRRDADGPMQVVSGVYGISPTVHFEAPPATRLDADVRSFLDWFEATRTGLNGIVRAGLAHLRFVTIHPMDDGNGRIARAVADLAISQMEGTGQRFYSMSSQIEREKKTYYDMLESTQKGGLDVTPWLAWFADCYRRAVLEAEKASLAVVRRARFLGAFDDRPPLSERQEKVLRRLLDGFDGNMTAKRWGNIAKCSPDTALRDITDLIEKGMMVRNPGGSRNASYGVNWAAVGLDGPGGDAEGPDEDAEEPSGPRM